MASHGVPRQSSTGPKSERDRQKELREIQEYKDLVDQVTKRGNDEDYTPESLAVTSKLLNKNPEYYTVWNHRRRILRHLLDEGSRTSGDAEGQEYAHELISSDLDFLFPLLLKFPKCYWIWNHRLWLLQQVSARLPREEARSVWQQELNLVAKMLSRDNRNFHGWDYRRTVIAALRKFTEPSDPTLSATQTEPSAVNPEAQTAPSKSSSLTENEFAYTTKMVRGNLSNFSAWHNRSKLIPRLLEERAASYRDRRALFEEELEFVSEALSIDPNDQSLWFYHQFLMSSLRVPPGETCFGATSEEDRERILSGQLELFREVLEDWDKCKLLYQNLLHLAELWMSTLEKRGHDGDDSGGSMPGREEMHGWLGRLRELDPMRAGRWTDLEAKLGL